EGKKLLDWLTRRVDDFKRRADKLEHALGHESDGSADKHAKHFRDVVIPAMTALREAGDELELSIPHETWPLATYREMLFIKGPVRAKGRRANGTFCPLPCCPLPLCPLPCCPPPCPPKQISRQILHPRIDRDGRDRFPGSDFLRQLHGRGDVQAARRSNEDALFAREPARHRACVRLVDRARVVVRP